jgi:hypothetical protein
MKVPFAIIDKEIDKMYEEVCNCADDDAAMAVAENISKFLKRCGWTEEEYIARLLDYDQSN